MLKTIFHAYYYDLGKPQDRHDYASFCEARKQDGVRCFAAFCPKPGDSFYKSDLDGRAAILETEHLFDNQWNMASTDGYPAGLRIFDWAEDAGLPNENIKRGHWLEQTPDMREIRRNTMKCCYCGKQEPAAKGYVFCPHCIDSEHLKETDLYLTRMMPVDRSKDGPALLTQAESDYLLPKFREAQIHGATERGKQRLLRARHDIELKYRAAIENAKIEHDGMVWLMDRGIRLDNVIFYSHTGRFCFGWRKPYGPEELSALLEALGAEFPFDYDIKKA